VVEEAQEEVQEALEVVGLQEEDLAHRHEEVFHLVEVVVVVVAVEEEVFRGVEEALLPEVDSVEDGDTGLLNYSPLLHS